MLNSFNALKVWAAIMGSAMVGSVVFTHVIGKPMHYALQIVLVVLGVVVAFGALISQYVLEGRKIDLPMGIHIEDKSE